MRDVARSASADVHSGTSSLVGAPDEVFGIHRHAILSREAIVSQTGSVGSDWRSRPMVSISERSWTIQLFGICIVLGLNIGQIRLQQTGSLQEFHGHKDRIVPVPLAACCGVYNRVDSISQAIDPD
jgi:hypothetical protein